MSNWNFYFTTIDKHPASVFVATDILEHAPIPQLPYLVRLQMQMTDPRPDGLSSSEEAPQLFKFEDALKANVSLSPMSAIFVGRITSAGKREFFLYTSSADTLKIGLDDLFRKFPEYSINIREQDDPHWQTYLSLLPNDEQQQQIEDRKVCEILEREGDNLTHQREIDHWIYFDTVDARDRFSSQASRSGFQVRCLLDGKPGLGAFGIQLYRLDVPSFTLISSVTITLFHLARNFGGHYDGWEAEVIKVPEP